uniref:Uncharacterized protein n=1 Tax=Lepeophtheirus salmonis TaxID=72036 RepID=A0A0K2SWC3_LEPSM
MKWLLKGRTTLVLIDRNIRSGERFSHTFRDSTGIDPFIFRSTMLMKNHES